MAHDSAPKGPRSNGLSLYANLLDSSPRKDSAPGTISRAPVVFKQPAGEDVQQDRTAADKQQISAASLRFQPTKRPQLSSQKPKTKSLLQKTPVPPPPSIPIPSDLANAAARPPAKTTLADWTAEVEDNDVNGFYGGEKRQRGGRKKRKRNKEESHMPQNWDDVYDPSRPNNYDDYKHSDEKIMEIREWKDKLYAHRISRRRDSDLDSSVDHYKPQSSSRFVFAEHHLSAEIGSEQHARPGLSFAPPANFDDSDRLQPDPRESSVPKDPTGEDAYERRIRLSGPSNQAATPGLPPVSRQPELRSPPLPSPPPALEVSKDRKPHPPSVASVPPPPNISRAPVRYNLPVAPSEIPASEAELENALQTDQFEEGEPSDTAPRSLRPGQKGFAERLMSKYGWNKGSGLGASGSGIVNPLRVQVEKQKKKPDSEGGGFVGPGGRGKIVGGRKKGGSGVESEVGKFGAMSEVVILRGMVDGMDLDAEMEGSGDGGLMQEIGEECGDKYGRVERVFIDRSDPSEAPVFVKFTSQLSALRAVNALEGRIFNGNNIVARFFDIDKFESGVYE